MEKPIIICLKCLMDKIPFFDTGISKEDLSLKFKSELLDVLSKAFYVKQPDEDPGKITVDIELKKPVFQDSVTVVTDPDTGERYGRVPFEHTHEFQIMELTKILKNLGDGSFTVTIVPKKKEVGETGS